MKVIIFACFRYKQHKTDYEVIPKDRPICVPCRVSHCQCQSYHYVPLNGTQPIRCRCKHFADQHSAAPGFSCNSCKLLMVLQPSLLGNLTGTAGQGSVFCPEYQVRAALVTDAYFGPCRRMGNGKEDIAFCTGGFRTTALGSPSSVKESKFLNDSVRCIWRQLPQVRRYESTPFTVCHFHCCMHVTFLLELGSLREGSVDLCSSIAWLNIMLMYFYIFSQLNKKQCSVPKQLAL